EYRGALASYTALREVGKPADLFVFPNEHHIKWQPAHRLAAYWRSLDWFDYWLRGLLPGDERRRDEAQRWAAMDRRRCDIASGSDGHRVLSKPAANPCLGIQQ
ncbi:MAG: peptidase, partial [Pseudomonadota bacterium]|nr:peptidase [Pseudomonadota bacterium]